jgi:hypothetical protein
VLRPADNLEQNQWELGFGVAVNQFGQGLPVFQANYGFTDWLEIGVQHEIYSSLLWLKAAPLRSRDHGLAVSFSLGAGDVHLFQGFNSSGDVDKDLTRKTGALLLGAHLGRKFDWFEPYLAYRLLFINDFDDGAIHAVKMGTRFTIYEQLVFILEGGATVHNGDPTLNTGALAIAEVTAGLAYKF